MGFNSVYSTLHEVFPQVDSRLLRAVALEHYKDADMAVEVVLHEIIPHLPEQPHTMSFDHDANRATEANCDSSPLLLNKTSGESNADDKTLTASESKQLVCVSETNLPATQESDAFAVEFVASEDKSATCSGSEQICSTEILDEIIEDAKTNKKTLETAMNSVIEFMREVESKEKTAEQAKEYAAHGCSDILSKVDEVKHALSRAKEANDMHSGEVNAERAILATELKELQLRLLSVSDERNKSLEILDEMRRDLEFRMAAALEQIAAAEEQKIERELSAREALLYQETQMEKVVEESKKLKLVAEENSKLQEFLMDRGRAIDILQGEIAVKCQDVLLLKEKFDKRIPLSRSLFSSQTSSVSASSGSSLRSSTKPFEPEIQTYETPKKSSGMDDESYGLAVADKGSRSPKGIIDDDGWELFDENGDLLVR